MPAWGRYEELRPAQIDAILEEAPVAYLPWGALEWHGPHNPIGLDALKAHGLCMMAAEQTGGVVWPPIYVGYRTMKPHAGFKHTIEVPAEIVLGLANAYLDQLDDEGYKVVFLLLGHYGGEHLKAIYHAAQNWPTTRGKGSDMRILAYPDFLLREEGSPLPPGGHAGACETSLMMLFRPDLVSLDQLPTEGPAVGMEAGLGIGGEDPRKSSVETGSALAREIVGAMVERVTDELDLASS